ncbi:integral membrane protein DUF106-domain-containing protein [Kockovaella imperatae]|uniref:ER membrane protein complex subunit 3 n=1 Tax=Kockovaella imperatae TaxID=4999 RepID=A0A1Y1UM33_9TREE|nr:integral membrane protein DUF106-domain-containing protein [Kockovaella imperatae]ORX39111.1 integral membrane protein DUF106-domain-containing protein [Kockovaella imperatae]
MGVKAAQDLYLDPSIRNWVLVPITLIMLLVGILRHYVTMLLTSPPKPAAVDVVREQRAIGRAQLLRMTAPFSPLSPAAYRSISAAHSTVLTSGQYLKIKPKPKEGEIPNPFEGGGMENAMEGMKKQAVMMVPNMVIMQYISIFFSGFVLIKLPFPLTAGFKSLMSKDIMTPDLDVRWVSALSWYFLNLFGLNGVFRLILGDAGPQVESRDANALAQLSGAGAVSLSGPGAPDMEKLFKAETENLALAEGLYRWSADGVEDRVLEIWGKKQ